MDKKCFYYKDELVDEFSGIKRNPITIDHTYKYLHKNIVYHICKFLVYRVIMKLVSWFYTKLKFHVKFVNGNLLKTYNGETVFVYGNHTNIPHDAYAPNALTITKDISFIVNPDNVSLPGTRTFMAFVGALPLPNTLSGMRPFTECLENICKHPGKKGRLIVVYPEAHIWPYYTKIRSFPDQSFQYPLQFGSKVFSMTTTYQRRKNTDKVNVTVYIDGPFIADKNLGKKAARKKLRDEVYTTMVDRSKNSNFEVNNFVKMDNKGIK
jgi:1-acyl-sn-glycerol-3-phosphate acyltransferase